MTELESAQTQARKQVVTELKAQLEQLDQQLTESRQQLERELQAEQERHADIHGQTQVSLQSQSCSSSRLDRIRCS